jgi:hypothetical protein
MFSGSMTFPPMPLAKPRRASVTRCLVCGGRPQSQIQEFVFGGDHGAFATLELFVYQVHLGKQWMRASMSCQEVPSGRSLMVSMASSLVDMRGTSGNSVWSSRQQKARGFREKQASLLFRHPAKTRGTASPGRSSGSKTDGYQPATCDSPTLMIGFDRSQRQIYNDDIDGRYLGKSIRKTLPVIHKCEP